MIDLIALTTTLFIIAAFAAGYLTGLAERRPPGKHRRR